VDPLSNLQAIFFRNIYFISFQLFEGNVIPDAGNEVVVNVYQTPVEVKCIAVFPADYHEQKIIRFDVIGCEI
jgi:hypothetical protein